MLIIITILIIIFYICFTQSSGVLSGKSQSTQLLSARLS